MLRLSLIFRRRFILIILIVVPLLIIGLHHSSNELSWRCSVKASKLISDVCISFTHLVCIGLDGCDILHVSRGVSSNDGHILLWFWKMCIWLRKYYVGYHKIWWGHGYTTPMLALVHHRSNSVAPEFLQMVAHNLVAHLLLGLRKNFLLQSLLPYFSSPAQEVLPLTNLFYPQEKPLILHR
jgi:hypothetical protein